MVPDRLTPDRMTRHPGAPQWAITCGRPGSSRTSQLEILMRPGSTQVLVEHEGRWLVADVLDQVRSRDDGHWRVVVRFSTEPGATYLLAMPADQCRVSMSGQAQTHELRR
jgi:hypothetical protein